MASISSLREGTSLWVQAGWHPQLLQRRQETQTIRFLSQTEHLLSLLVGHLITILSLTLEHGLLLG